MPAFVSPYANITERHEFRACQEQCPVAPAHAQLLCRRESVSRGETSTAGTRRYT